MNGFNAFIGGVQKGQAAHQRRQSAFNASMMPGGAEVVHPPALRQTETPRRRGENTGMGFYAGERGGGPQNLSQIFAGLDTTKRQQVKADLTRKRQIVSALLELPADEQVVGIQAYGKDFGIDSAALQRATANPAKALTVFSSSIQQAETMLEQVGSDNRHDSLLGNALSYSNPIALGSAEPDVTLMAQLAEGQVSAPDIPPDDLKTPSRKVLDMAKGAEQIGEVPVIGTSKKPYAPDGGKFTVDESIQRLTKEIENTDVRARRRSIPDAFAEKRLEQYGDLANLKLHKLLKERGINILNIDDLSVDKLYPTHPSQSGKNYIKLSGKNADFELPGAIGNSSPNGEGVSSAIVNLPIAKGGHPWLNKNYLSEDSVYLDSLDKRTEADLNLVILSDVYTDGSGNFYRGYVVRTWIGPERQYALWSLGRSTTLDVEYVSDGQGGSRRLRDFQDSNTSAVDIVDLDVITPINASELSKIKAGIDEAQTGFDRIGNIYVRKGN